MDILSYYNQIAAIYDKDRFENSYGRFIHAEEIFFLERHLNKNATTTLDVGCGTGRFLNYATHGIDLSPEMLAIAKEKFPNKDLKISDATATGFENNSFEQAFSMHVFMHLDFETSQNILNEVHRILQPNALFIFDFPSQKRRFLSHRTKENWHGSNEMSIEKLQQLLENKWVIKHYEGILFLPIHRFPKSWRKSFLRLDQWLCRSFLKGYASYLVVVLERSA